MFSIAAKLHFGTKFNKSVRQCSKPRGLEIGGETIYDDAGAGMVIMFLV